jgi:hypothetical protein
MTVMALTASAETTTAPQLAIEGVDAGRSDCDMRALVAGALQSRRVTAPGAAMHLARANGRWTLTYDGRERSLGAVSCREAASLVAAIVSRPADEASPAGTPEPPPRASPPSVLPPRVPKETVAEQTPPSASQAPPRKTAPRHVDGTRLVAPSGERPDPPSTAPVGAPSLRVLPTATPPEASRAAAPQTSETPGPVDLPELPSAPRITPRLTPRITPRLALGLGAFATSSPQVLPVASLHAGVGVGRWLVEVSGEVSWPTATTVSTTSLRGTLRSQSFSALALLGRCFDVGGAALCPAVTSGARFLSTSLAGDFYRSTSALRALPVVGLDVSVTWRLSGDWGLVLRVAPWVPLGSGSMAVEGTDASSSTGRVEGLATIGIGWRYF